MNISKNTKYRFMFFLVFLIIINFVIIQDIVKNYDFSLELSENVYFAFYVDNVEINTFPGKDEGYVLDEEASYCSDGAKLYWDHEEWSPKIKNLSTTKTKCQLYFKTYYVEDILYGVEPVLTDELVPVTIEDDGIVKKANLGSTWYSYANKQWANAVILEKESESANYLAGEVIPESAIESYFVWIPKYRYQIWNLGTYNSLGTIDTKQVRTISIQFGNYNTSDSVSGECTTPMTSGASGNCGVGEYMTHPAFLSIPSTGFWVGKFATTYKNSPSVECNIENISIKPGILMWATSNMNVSVQHLNSFNYKRHLDSHMMKNTEWGAVAYLSHSKYGSSSKIRLNNNNYLTGYAATKAPTCGYTGTNEECNAYGTDVSVTQPYNTESGYTASTTGNITGIYDMAGTDQVMMAFTLSASGDVIIGLSTRNSGFNGVYGDTNGSLTTGVKLPEAKYYDVYQSESVSINRTYYRRILGDATGELGPFEIVDESFGGELSSWYNELMDQYYSSYYSVAHRGYGRQGGYVSGIFAFQGGYGKSSASFRIILTPTK